ARHVGKHFRPPSSTQPVILRNGDGHSRGRCRGGMSCSFFQTALPSTQHVPHLQQENEELMAISYKDAGVDLKSYEEAMGQLAALMQRTQTASVLTLVGGFAGLFQLQGDQRKYADPVLVSGTDGVGTKIKVALMAGKYDTIGIDLVGMCVNDCLCLGA